MYKFHNKLLPSTFNYFFTRVSKIHNYNTRVASKQSFYLPKARTNYGNNKIFQDKLWNLINHKNKSFSLNQFKKTITDKIVCKY